MAPPIEAFSPSELTKRIQITTADRQRKPPIDLKKCQLREMLQYNCDLDGPRENKNSKVICEPVLRMFRR